MHPPSGDCGDNEEEMGRLEETMNESDSQDFVSSESRLEFMVEDWFRCGWC